MARLHAAAIITRLPGRERSVLTLRNFDRDDRWAPRLTESSSDHLDGPFCRFQLQAEKNPSLDSQLVAYRSGQVGRN